jgi:zinc D-Ala-D-Ala carboxypeptidase
MIKYLKSLFMIILVAAVACSICCAIYGNDSGAEIYGKTQPKEYLSGEFKPSEHPLFVSLQKIGVPTDGKEHYLRKEAAQALFKMYKAFSKKYPEADFYVRSSTRNWYDQKAIWESKWEGRTLVNGKQLNTAIPDHLKRAMKILEYSSMPGTSRHHWGTDFDLCELKNEYYESGDGMVLYEWLNNNAESFGFCRPYTAGRKSGYREEKWHWSYAPLSKIFLTDWIRIFGDNKYLSGAGLFPGSEKAGRLASVYVNSINDECR